MTHDPVNHPSHYTTHPSGVECIQVTEHMNFCVGNAVKYVFRRGLKGSYEEDLRKAVWYLEREIQRRKVEVWEVWPSDDRYEVSNLGRVRNLETNRCRKPVRIKNGYYTMLFAYGETRKLCYVHRIVVETFLGAIPKDRQVAHNDGDKSNNKLHNLRITSGTDNLNDRIRHGTSNRGPKNGKAVLSVEQALSIRQNDRSHTRKELADMYGVSLSTVGRILRGESWQEETTLLDTVSEHEESHYISQFYLTIKEDDLQKAAWYIEREIERRKTV